MLSDPGAMAQGWELMPPLPVQVSPLLSSRGQVSLPVCIPGVPVNHQVFLYNWVRQPCDLLTASVFLEKMLISWIIVKILCGYAWHGSRRLADVSFARWNWWSFCHPVVSHCRLLQSCSLAVFILLLCAWGEPLEKYLDPYESEPAWEVMRENAWGEKYRFLS